MKKLISILILFFSVETAFACPFCGCGTGNYMGLLPRFEKHFTGIRYQYSSFKTAAKDDPAKFSNDRFQSIEWWGGYTIGKNWQLVAIVPYHFVRHVSDKGTINSNGIGDVVVIGSYQVFDLASDPGSKTLVTQQLWVGGGVKLGTGKFSVSPGRDDYVQMANLQTGSGSHDFILNGLYNISINGVAISTNAQYKINTENDVRYFFGNRFSASSLAFFPIKRAGVIFTPNAGFTYEHNSANKLYHEKIGLTGGYFFGAAAGAEFRLNKLTLGVNAQLPLSQNFSGNQTKTNLKGIFHTTFSF